MALASGARTAAAVFGAGWRNFAAYTAATLHLTRRNDAFFQSMRGSIGAFHAALDAGLPPPIDGAFGAMLVDTCERMGSAAFRPVPLVSPAPRNVDAACDVAILGGTGFIGTHVVRRFVAEGARVAVMARSVRNLPAIFGDDAVTLHRGDLRDADAVAAAIAEDGRPTNETRHEEHARALGDEARTECVPMKPVPPRIAYHMPGATFRGARGNEPAAAVWHLLCARRCPRHRAERPSIGGRNPASSAA